MSYALRILPHAEKQLSQLNSPIYDSIKARIFELRDAPSPPGCRKLRGREGWRIRVSDYRVIYKINDIEKLSRSFKLGTGPMCTGRVIPLSSGLRW
jgi:mRNA interferase RelE/StbE